MEALKSTALMTIPSSFSPQTGPAHMPETFWKPLTAISKVWRNKATILQVRWGYKFSVYEGGMRIPFLIDRPNHIKPVQPASADWPQ